MRADILLAGPPALGAVSQMLDEDKGELKERFPLFFAPYFRSGILGSEELSARFLRAGAAERREILRGTAERAAGAAGKCGAEHVLPLGAGGILKGLWELGEMTESGMVIPEENLPFAQETLEFCEYSGTDPYYADSSGAVLMTSREGMRAQLLLRDAGIDACVLGALTDTRARILCRGSHRRYLDKPRAWL